jgi:hypothetical protein
MEITNKNDRSHWQFSKAHTGSRFACGFQNYIPLCFRHKIMQAAYAIQNHQNPNVRNIGQGEAQHRKYKRFKLGGGQAFDRPSD